MYFCEAKFYSLWHSFWSKDGNHSDSFNLADMKDIKGVTSEYILDLSNKEIFASGSTKHRASV